jgi:hypothetical protein
MIISLLLQVASNRTMARAGSIASSMKNNISTLISRATRMPTPRIGRRRYLTASIVLM